ncbi:gluconokinase/shikimate kinase [Litoreibacter halocynthiae]|uniref:Gluconokinase n=1 Tax=Litoreibacter halocynthiae TaxID=1242689 RepID=A0A4R7LJ25_9RHOB|nr:gluconokinase [Litoreibacter halocynthiae]TDT74050.1 gluconokinase/shikimate kinase [Litoreibacter halocynthiae]
MLKAIVMGVAGSGKSSVGHAVAGRLGAHYFDGDDLHPQSNIEKMAAGTPLDDSDRAPWLDKVGAALMQAGGPTLIGCSALKRSYRDRIRAACPQARFVHLIGNRAVIEARMSARTGHFMPVSLLDSQFATLEPLQADEAGFAIDIAQDFDAVVQQVVACF